MHPHMNSDEQNNYLLVIDSQNALEVVTLLNVAQFSVWKLPINPQNEY